MARAHLGQRRFGHPGRGRHLGVPLVAARPLGVLDLDGHRRAERATVADAADQSQVVDLEALARAPPVAEAAPGQLTLDVFDRDVEPGREPLDDHDQCRAVRLPRRQVPQHGWTR